MLTKIKTQLYGFYMKSTLNINTQIILKIKQWKKDTPSKQSAQETRSGYINIKQSGLSR